MLRWMGEVLVGETCHGLNQLKFRYIHKGKIIMGRDLVLLQFPNVTPCTGSLTADCHSSVVAMTTDRLDCNLGVMSCMI